MKLRDVLDWLERVYLLLGALVFGVIVVIATISAIMDGGQVLNGCDMIWWCHLAVP